LGAKRTRFGDPLQQHPIPGQTAAWQRRTRQTPTRARAAQQGSIRQSASPSISAPPAARVPATPTRAGRQAGNTASGTSPPQPGSRPRITGSSTRASTGRTERNRREPPQHLRTSGVAPQRAGLLGQVRAQGPPVRRPGQSRHHRRRQPLARRNSRGSRHIRRPDQHLPGLALPADRQTKGQETRPGRRGQLHPHHRLAPAIRPRHPLHRPRPLLA